MKMEKEDAAATISLPLESYTYVRNGSLALNFEFLFIF